MIPKYWLGWKKERERKEEGIQIYTHLQRERKKKRGTLSWGTLKVQNQVLDMLTLHWHILGLTKEVKLPRTKSTMSVSLYPTDIGTTRATHTMVPLGTHPTWWWRNRLAFFFFRGTNFAMATLVGWLNYTRKQNGGLYSNLHPASTTQPPTVVWKMEAHLKCVPTTRCMHVFARLAPTCNAPSVLINKISASEHSRKFIKSASLVGTVSAGVRLPPSLGRWCRSFLLFLFPALPLCLLINWGGSLFVC